MAFWQRGGRIAVLEMHGMIGGVVRPSTHVPLLRALEESRRVAGVVLDIDSPGGAVPASEELYLSVQRLAKAKPVTAYIRGTGTSGSYYIACGARRIVALPSALVGSIGVIQYRPLVTQLLDKLGVKMDVYKSGALKDMGAPWRADTPEEAQRFQSLVNELYAQFVNVVAQSRKLDAAKAMELATGEVFTGMRAKQVGLVDALGDMEDVLNEMQEGLKLKQRRVSVIRPPRPWYRRFLGGFAQDLVGAAFQEAEARMGGGRIVVGAVVRGSRY
jgi:protease-4